MKGVTKAALYMRLSKDDEQFGDSISIETQRSISATLSKNTGFLCLMNMLMTDGPEQIFDRPNF